MLHVNESNPLGLKAKAPKMLKAREMYKPEGKTFKGKFDKKFASKRASGGKKKKHEDVLACNVTVPTEKLISSLQRVEEWTA